MIGKIPKLAIVGLIVLLIGFSPEVLATVNIDTVGPRIMGYWPNGTSSTPTSFNLNETITLRLDADMGETLKAYPYCDITSPTGQEKRVTLTNSPSAQYRYEGSFGIVEDGAYYFFRWYAEDLAGNPWTKTTYGEVGDADGDFYMKDGDDASYTLVSKDSTITFNHRTLHFKFNATNHGHEIGRVWIEVVGHKTFDLSETIVDAEWDGSSWTALSDGTYTVNGYFRAFGKDYRGLGILVGAGEEPTAPSEWSMYDWLKIIGGALIVVGLITKK